MKTNIERFDDILREAFCLLREEETAALEIAAQSLPPDQELESRIMALIYPRDKRYQPQKHRKTVHRVLSTAAVVLLVITISFTALLLVSPTARAYVENIIKEIYAEYNNYRFSTKETTVEEGDYALGYIPEGFELVHERHGESGNNVLTYENRDKDVLVFTYAPASNVSHGIDNENLIHEDIEINGMEGIIAYDSVHDKFTAIVLLDANISLSITTHLSRAETIKIAENIQSHLFLCTKTLQFQ